MTLWPGPDLLADDQFVAEPVAGPCRVRSRRFAALDVEDWIGWWGLGVAAGDDNLFASPWFAASGLAAFDTMAAIDMVIVEGSDRRWIGAMPLVRDSRLGRVPLSHWRNWTHSNQFLGTPLVRIGMEDDYWRAMLAHLDRSGPAMHALRLTEIVDEDRVLSALRRVAGQQKRPLHCIRAYDRAVLAGGAGAEAQWSRVCPRRRARLRSLRRRLAADHGAVTVRWLSDGKDVGEWVARFLAIEASGWKGIAGSALAADGATSGFFASVVEGAIAAGRCDMAALEVGGRTIAMSAHLLGPRHGFGFKKCYDEAFAAYAPGLLLLEDVTKALAERDGLVFDSCSTPDSQAINGLWPDRRRIVDVCVALGGPARRLRFHGAMAARTVWHRLKPRG